MDSTLVIKNSNTYCKNLLVIETKYYAHAPRGRVLVGVNHCAIPTSTQRMTIKEILHAPNLLDNGSPYVHATGLTNLNTSISQIHNYSTSMTLISPSSYLKTIVKHQTPHSIQCTLYESFYYIPLGCPSY